MLKGLPVGLVLGALLAFGLFHAVEARRAAAAAASPAVSASGSAGPASAEAEALRSDVASLGAEKERLDAELADLEGRLAEAKKTGGAAGEPVAAKGFRNPWSPMAKKLFELRARLDEVQSEDGEEFRDLMLQFTEIAKELMEEDGFNLNEFESSPYGSPMLMLAVLEGAEPPVDAETMKKAQDAVAKAQDAWKELKKRRAGMGELEWRRDGAQMVWGAMDGIRAALTPEQKEWFSQGRIWSEDSVHLPIWPTSGTREQVEQGIVADLVNRVGLGGSEIRVQPVVAEYLRKYSEMEADWKARAAAGKPPTAGEKELGRASLVIEMQRGIRETISLTEEQAKALREFDHAWEVTIVP